MAEKRGKTDRSETRVQVVPTEIRGLITNGSEQQPFLIWDVSEKGIGLWVSEKLKIGQEVVLTVGQPYLLVVKCITKWCEAQTDNKGFRCGLKSIDKVKTFEALFKAFVESKGSKGPL
jgi:hypothetical protein